MLPLLILLLQWRVTTCISSPTLEDNMLPTDEEVISDLINSYRGQPEQEIALNLPTDEEAFNEIKPILQSANPLYYINSGGHFISSSFPEIDSRGFHESVFDDEDEFYPISQRGKKYDSSALAINARGFYGDIFTDGFGSFHPVKKNRKDTDVNLQSPLHSISRQKRSSPMPNLKAEMSENSQLQNVEEKSLSVKCTTDGFSKSYHCGTQNSTDTKLTFTLKNDDSSIWRLLNFDQRAYPHTVTPSIRFKNASKSIPFRYKRNVYNLYHSKDWRPLANHFRDEAKHKRKPEVDSTGFHNDIFDRIGEFDTLRKRKSGIRFNRDDIFQDEYSSRFEPLKRVPEMGETGFHGDVFHNQFGRFDTLKRTPDMGKAGFHGDVFHKSFGNFETLRKRRPHGNDFDDRAFDYDLFNTVKRRPTQSILNGDAFHSNFGNFDTMKRTLAGDAFHSQFGRFETMKRRPEIDLTGYGRQLNTFQTLKRTPELISFPFHRDKVYTPKKLKLYYVDPRIQSSPSDIGAVGKYEKFKNFIRNYVPTSRFDDLRGRSRLNETISLSQIRRTTSA